MSNEKQDNLTLDVNSITAEILSRQIKDAGTKLLSGLKSVHNFINAQFRVGYDKYINKVTNQYSRTKSFFAAHIRSIYMIFSLPPILELRGK